MASRLKKFFEYQLQADTRELLVPLKTKAIILPFVQTQVAIKPVTQLEPPEIIEERICMLVSDVRLPYPWAEAVVKLQAMSRPVSIPPKAWEDIQLACSQLYLDDFVLLKLIISCGWGVHDIYGCHPTAPLTRFDEMGLLLLLHAGDEAVGVNAERIKILHKSGSKTNLQKRQVTPAEENLLFKLNTD